MFFFDEERDREREREEVCGREGSLEEFSMIVLKSFNNLDCWTTILRRVVRVNKLRLV